MIIGRVGRAMGKVENVVIFIVPTTYYTYSLVAKYETITKNQLEGDHRGMRMRALEV